jgi:hypothetical protein
MMRIGTPTSQILRILSLSLPLICTGSTYLAGVVQAQVLKWEIGATVVEIEDPESQFPKVQLGDPVRGFLSYDLSAPPDAEDPNDIFYNHDPPFAVAGMAIENPRDGSKLEFLPDTSLPGIVEVINDGEDEIFGVSDSVLALQSVLPPDGSAELFPSIVISGLIGPADVLADASLPLELHLDDWPDAVISYIDLIGGAFIFAEIHTLTFVPEPMTTMLVIGAIAPLLASRSRRIQPMNT